MGVSDKRELQLASPTTVITSDEGTANKQRRLEDAVPGGPAADPEAAAADQMVDEVRKGLLETAAWAS